MIETIELRGIANVTSLTADQAAEHLRDVLARRAGSTALAGVRGVGGGGSVAVVSCRSRSTSVGVARADALGELELAPALGYQALRAAAPS